MTTDYRAELQLLFDAAESFTEPALGHHRPWATALERARALLAQPEPEGPVGPTDDEIYKLALEGDFLVDVGDGFSCMVQDKVGFARAVLARWGQPAVTPIPVAERLPGPEDCDAEGKCWLLFRSASMKMTPVWSLVHRRSIFDGPYTHWLPANALPVPTND